VVLFRFLFAPVLLAVAVLSASPSRHASLLPREAGGGAAHPTAPAGPLGGDRAGGGAPAVGAHAAATPRAPAR
jgi:hypothetical protein